MRGGARLGHSQLVDGMLHDGLWDAFHNIHMGECAGECGAAGAKPEGMQGAGWRHWADCALRCAHVSGAQRAQRERLWPEADMP